LIIIVDAIFTALHKGSISIYLWKFSLWGLMIWMSLCKLLMLSSVHFIDPRGICAMLDPYPIQVIKWIFFPKKTIREGIICVRPVPCLCSTYWCLGIKELHLLPKFLQEKNHYRAWMLIEMRFLENLKETGLKNLWFWIIVDMQFITEWLSTCEIPSHL